MSRHEGSLPAPYFEQLYEADPDPWKFATSPYEREKYDATIAALGQAPYARALEVGCSIGVLTRALAERCEDLVAIEPVASALDAARARCRDAGHVRFIQGTIPDAWPAGMYDLIVLSEVAYYLDFRDLDVAVGQIAHSVAPEADLVLVHWTGETNYPLSGDQAAEHLIGGLTRTGAMAVDPSRSSRMPEYRLDVLHAA